MLARMAQTTTEQTVLPLLGKTLAKVIKVKLLALFRLRNLPSLAFIASKWKLGLVILTYDIQKYVVEFVYM